jgi:hypothetical protein
VHVWINNPHEAYQLLHHCAVYQCNIGIFAVGNEERLLYVLFVIFPMHLRDSYIAACNFLFEEGLQWAYGPLAEVENNGRLSKAIEFGQFDKKIDMHSLMTSLHLWRAVCVDNGVKLPLPPCKTLLPYTNSLWNRVKGPSDTTTKLASHCPVIFPVNGAEQALTGRLLQIIVINFHRALQMPGASSELERYRSLRAYRAAATVRQPFHQTNMYLSRWLKKQAAACADTLSADNSDGGSAQRRQGFFAQCYSSIRRATGTRSQRKSIDVMMIPPLRTGGTPVRGRRDLVNKTEAEKRKEAIRQQCTGILIFRVKDDQGSRMNGRCSVCTTKTSWYCTQCGQWFCPPNLPRNDIWTKLKTKRVDKEYRSVKYFRGSSFNFDGSVSQVIHGVYSCFHHAHATAIEAQLQNLSTIN